MKTPPEKSRLDVLAIGDGPCTVVAVHGIQGTRASWLPVAQRLASEARWVLPNLRGRGLAWRGAGPQDYSLAAFADELREVIDAHAVPGRPLMLAGWSMGVSVCLDYVLRGRGARPGRLMLLSGTPSLCEAHWFHATQAPALAQEAALRQQRLGLMVAADHAAVAATWLAIRAHDHRPQLAQVRCPALVLHGREDADSPWPHAMWLVEGLPGARLITLENAGHGILASHTDRVVQAAQEFLFARRD